MSIGIALFCVALTILVGAALALCAGVVRNQLWLRNVITILGLISLGVVIVESERWVAVCLAIGLGVGAIVALHVVA
jgi:hypothetical protein